MQEFYKRRIIFWQDEDREFEKIIDEITIPDVTIVKLTGSNNRTNTMPQRAYCSRRLTLPRNRNRRAITAKIKIQDVTIHSVMVLSLHFRQDCVKFVNLLLGKGLPTGQSADQ